MSDSKALTIVPKTLDEVTSMAEVLAKSTLLPDALRGKVPDVIVSILAGQELGLSPMAAIRGVHVVQGKPLLSADTMVGLVRGSGLCEYFMCVEDTDTKVTYETKRKGDPQPQRSTWTVEDTKRAGLQTKDNWRMHTRQMMKARAKSILARDAYPDVLAGVYDPDELHVPVATLHAVPTAPEVIDDAEIVDVVAEAKKAIADATSEDALRLVAKDQLSKLSEADKAKVHGEYKTKMASFAEVKAS